MNRSVRSLIAAASAAGALVTVVGTATAADTHSETATPRCHGLPVTVAEHGGIVHGTPKADVIRLTRKGTVYGGRGNDIICGSGAADRIYSGGGNDIVLAGPGADLVRGGAGRDSVFGEAGNDRLSGGTGRNRIVAGAGRDVVAETALDSVSFDELAVSISIPPAGLQEIYESGLSVAIARQTGGLAPVWTAFQPLQSNSVSWESGGYSVYTSDTATEPGARIAMLARESTVLGSTWTWEPSGMILPGGSGPAGRVDIRNDSMQPLTAGLAQAVTANEQDDSAPITAQQVLPSAVATITPPTAFSLFLAANAQTGMLWSIPPDAVIGTVSAQHPTATFNYDPATNRFVAR